MDQNNQSAMSELDKLIFGEQRDILAICIGQEKIKWTTVLALILPEFKNKQYLSYLIERYQQGHGDTIPSPYKGPPTAPKRKSNNITPTNAVDGATALSEDTTNPLTPVRLFHNQVWGEYHITPVINPHNVPTRHENQEGNINDRVYLNPNKKPSNYEKSANKTELLLTTTRHLQWISANSGKVSNIPRKVLHSMLNWYNAEVSKAELQDLPQIHNLYDPNELVRAFKTFCLSKQISLKLGNKTYDDLFTCNDPKINPILIVVAAHLHKF